jgi:hypothetical protein
MLEKTEAGLRSALRLGFEVFRLEKDEKSHVFPL